VRPIAEFKAPSTGAIDIPYFPARHKMMGNAVILLNLFLNRPFKDI
jgi:hypothetical protein